jgi:hypothetical protein
VESPQQVSVSGSRTPPTPTATPATTVLVLTVRPRTVLISWSACEHPSPQRYFEQRGIWCSYELNTNGAHGIPSELSLTTARGRQSWHAWSARAWPGFADTPAGRIAKVEVDELPTCAWLRRPCLGCRHPGGLHAMRYPFRRRLNLPLSDRLRRGRSCSTGLMREPTGNLAFATSPPNRATQVRVAPGASPRPVPGPLTAPCAPPPPATAAR